MIDIHAHILPWMDDGSESMEETLAMAEMAVSSGITCMAATPHWQIFKNHRLYEKKKRYQQILTQVKEAVSAEKIPLQIVPGMEIFGCGDLGEAMQLGTIASINHGGCYLIEFPFDMDPDEMRLGWMAILKCGGQPVIAHPERYFCIQDSPKLLYNWMLEGVYTQINRGSLLGRFGDEAEKTSHLLLSCNLGTCIASDAHHSYTRTSYLKDIQQLLEMWYPEGEAKRLLSDNPSRILQGEPVLAGRMCCPGKREIIS